MTGRIEKTVFISYRRTNTPWALAIYQHLTAQGYDVFFDYLSINSGDFERIILQNIRARAHFIVILTPSALERCIDPKDWLRREIEAALDEQRNIVPLMVESFDFGSPVAASILIDKLANLKKYNALRVPSEYFFEAMVRLREQYLNIPIESVLHPISNQTKQDIYMQQIAASNAKMVEKHELTSQEWFEKGYKAQELEEKIRYYTEAIRLKPDDAISYNNRGEALQEKGDLKSALRDFNEAIRLKSDYAEAYSNRGLVRRNNNEIDEAISDYDEAIRLKPDFASAFNKRGVARMKKNDIDGAIQDFDLAIKYIYYGEEYLPFFNRGLARRLKGDIDSAIMDFNEAIQLEPSYIETYYRRGMAFSAKGDNLSALPDLQKASQMNPKDGGIHASLVRVLKSLGRDTEAKKQELIARDLIQHENEYNEAFFEAICGNIDRALDCLEIWLKKTPLDKDWARQDPDFESVRDHPRFKELVGE
jgi:tetratricopeptide (TPR) repeat protein